MKLFIYTLIAIACGLLIYNITHLDFDRLFEGDSKVAAIGVMAAACVIMLLVILVISRKIAEKNK